MRAHLEHATLCERENEFVHPCAHSTHGPPCTRPTINMPFRQGFAANVLRTLGGALVLVGYDEIKRIIG